MTSRIVIEIAGEAVGKGRARVTKFGHVYSAPKTVRAEARLAFAAAQAMGNRPPLDGPLRLTAEIFVEVPRSWSGKRRTAAVAGAIKPTVRPDADNVLKLIADSCNRVVYRDDKQLIEVFVRKSYATAARMVITIEPISEAAP